MRKVERIIDSSMRANRGVFQPIWFTEHKIHASVVNNALQGVSLHEVEKKKLEAAASSDKTGQLPSSQPGNPASPGKSGKPASTGGKAAPTGKGKRFAPKLTKATKKTQEEKNKELGDDMDDYWESHGMGIVKDSNPRVRGPKPAPKGQPTW